MLDANPATLTKIGRVLVTDQGITVEGFDGDGVTCRDVAALAIVWALGELQRELLLTLERPGAGRSVVN